MSQFYGEVRGQAKTPASRRGSKLSGIHAHIRGWNIGVKVIGEEVDGRDTFEVWLTTGSNGSGKSRLLGTFHKAEDGSIEERKA